MKLPRKSIIISLSFISVLATGAVGYAMLGETKPKSDMKPVTLTQSVETPETHAVAQPEAPVVAETTEAPTTVETPAPVEPTSAPVVRTFEQIIYDYPNMSTNAPGSPECAGYLKREWPEYFLDHNREQNIKGISQTFVNVCTAIDGKMSRYDMPVLADYFRRAGVR